jgi:hypothetical protein
LGINSSGSEGVGGGGDAIDGVDCAGEHGSFFGKHLYRLSYP